AQFLGLGQGGLDLLMLDERAGHVRPQRLAVLVGAVQTAVAAGVTHDASPLRLLLCPAAHAWRAALLGAECPGGAGCVRARTLRSCVAGGVRAGTHHHLRNDRRSAWPALRCSPAASSGRPCPDAGPCPTALP